MTNELQDLFLSVTGHDPVVQALVAGLVIAGFNMLGAILVLVWRNPSERSLDGALGFAAGVMLAASFTSLILPGVEAAGGSVLPVLVGIALGALVLDRADAWVPHVHVLITGKARPDAARDGRLPAASVILFIVAVTLHNIPEGLAVGVGFGSGNLENALSLMLAIGFQNVPEGLAVSVAAINAGFDRRSYAALVGIRSGLVEVPLTVLGAWAVIVMAPLLPYAMGFAAGGMLYVIMDEIVPETHLRGHERIATLGLMIGVIVMLWLDVALT